MLLDLNDRAVMARLDDLQKMGLTRPESMVYAVLLSLGPSHARSLYRPAHHTREETYRILRSLESKGFVEIRMEKPMTFAAIEPTAAVRAFTSRINDEAMTRMKEAHELGEWLNAIRHSPRHEEQTSERNHLRILRGNQNMVEGRRLVNKCKSDYMFVATAEWLPKLESVGFLEPLISASKTGVRVRIITEIAEVNLDFVKKYQKHFEIRHHKDASQLVGLALCDDSDSMLALATRRENVQELVTLASDNVNLIEEVKFIFETLWNDAKPATNLLVAKH